VDYVVLVTGGVVISTFASRLDPAGGRPSEIAFLVIALVLATMLGLRRLGLYEPRALVDFARTVSLSLATGFVAGGGGLLIAYLLQIPLGSLWLYHWLQLLTVYLLVTRLVAFVWARPIAERGSFRKRVAIVGGGRAAEHAVRALETTREIEIAGIFDDRFDGRSPPRIHAYRKLGSIQDLAAFARRERIDLIIVAIPMSAEARLLQILKRLWELPVDIRISGDASGLKLAPRTYSRLGNLPLLPLFERPLSGWNWFLKACLDRTLATLALIVLSPLMIAVAIAVKIDSRGPILFRQRRYGFNNELIEVLKFRSMYVEAADTTASRLVTRGDPRVTRVGRFIRKTSIDELPQLFNVLAGSLSLVGPRPHATQAKAGDTLYEQVADGYFARHKVKPGITGWAQVNGWRGETDTHEKLVQRVKHDLEYIDNWSLWFDIYILLRTPVALLNSDNAY
jgi:Undecaprenyl-phosphate glucose phosphotransferase